MNQEIEEIRNRLHLYKDVAKYPALKDLESCLSHISTLEEKVKRDREKIEKLKNVLNDLVTTIEFLNPFNSGHPNIKLRIELDKARELLEEMK